MKTPILLLDNPDSEIRQRHGGVTGMVQELDVFMKVSDDVKEEPKAVNGIRKFISKLFLMILLFSVHRVLFAYILSINWPFIRIFNK